MAGGNGITFASTDDSRAAVDTPFDTLDKVNVANLAQQCRLLNCLMWHIVTDTNAKFGFAIKTITEDRLLDNAGL